jgi:hypothetical protein
MAAWNETLVQRMMAMPEGQRVTTDRSEPIDATQDLASALLTLKKADLQRMLAAGEEVLNCQRVLRKTSSNVVAELLRNQGTFYEWNHFPAGDAIDWETHSQYYYHAHPKGERPGEHGHFHTFLRYTGMPKGVVPAPMDHPQAPNDNRIGAHIIAVSMDKKGYGIRMFTVNRWVTDETWYRAADIARMIDKFEIDHTFPSWASNRWLSHMVILFKPQILSLLEQRDARITAWRARNPGLDVFEDRALEVTSECKIDVDKQIKAIRAALSARS